MTWESIAATKRQVLGDSIPAEWLIPAAILPSTDQLDVTNFPQESGFFTEHELEITSSPAPTILSHISSESWTSEMVTKAFCKTAAVAQQLVTLPLETQKEKKCLTGTQTNCLSEILFDRAISQAKELDAYFQKTGKTKGPLHGLPISLKDNINVIGYDSSIGFTSLVNKPAINNSTIVDILLEAGAVIYCKTNVPTAMMISETVNNLFGRTVNPLSRNLTTGGSSGGEAALIAFGGSRIGVGSDIGMHSGQSPIMQSNTNRFARRLSPHACCLHRHLHHPPILRPLPQLSVARLSRRPGNRERRHRPASEEFG
jgi:amidase